MKNEYKELFSSVSPDEALVESITQRKSPRRAARTALCVLLAVLLAAGGVLYGMKRAPKTAPSENGRRLLVFADASALISGEKKDGETFETPVDYELKIFTLEGMTEEERQAFIAEQRERFGIVPPDRLTEEELAAEEDDSIHMKEDASDAEDEYALPFVTDLLFGEYYAVIRTGDAFTVRVPEATALLDVTANCGSGMFLWFETKADYGLHKGTTRGYTRIGEGNENDSFNGWGSTGEVTAYDENGEVVAKKTDSAVFSDNSRKMEVAGSFYEETNGTGSVKVVWFPSEAVAAALPTEQGSRELDPTAISDVISFTARFNDGGEETCEAEISFTAEGRMTVTVK